MDKNGSKAGPLAALIAVPVMVVCCGGLAFVAGALGTLGAVGSWFSGMGTISALLVGLAVVLVVRTVWRNRLIRQNESGIENNE
ncbi:MAG: hypothetical protein ACE1Y4_12980 [Lysobacterales bacterium]